MERLRVRQVGHAPLTVIQQVLRKRLQGVTVRLGSEVKDGGAAREAEDAINELQRQMGDFERSVSDHQKTLEMTRRLQQAMEEVRNCSHPPSSSSRDKYLELLSHNVSERLLSRANSISSGVRRRAPPSRVLGSSPPSAAAWTPSLFSTSSLRSSCGRRFQSRRRGSVRSRSSPSGCTVSPQRTRRVFSLLQEG